MDNFTPLKEVKAKKKVNKFFLVGNLVLFLTIIVVGVYYLNTTKFPYKGKAAISNCDIVSNGPGCFKVQGNGCPTDVTLANIQCPKRSDFPNQPPCTEHDSRATSACFSINCGYQLFDFYSPSGGEIGGREKTLADCGNVPGPTHTPTPTPLISNTPTPTATPTNTPTPTETPVITNTPTPTATNTPTPTGTPVITNTPTATPTNTPTPVSVACGTKDCDSATNPCQSGFVCVQSTNGSNYCSVQAYVSACQANPSYNSCCTAPGAPTATPTETILAKVTPTVAKLLQTGVVKSFMYFIPAAIMLLGLIL